VVDLDGPVRSGLEAVVLARHHPMSIAIIFSARAQGGALKIRNPIMPSNDGF
jgi:hypothetical protein